MNAAKLFALSLFALVFCAGLASAGSTARLKITTQVASEYSFDELRSQLPELRFEINRDGNFFPARYGNDFSWDFYVIKGDWGRHSNPPAPSGRFIDDRANAASFPNGNVGAMYYGVWRGDLSVLRNKRAANGNAIHPGDTISLVFWASKQVGLIEWYVADYKATRIKPSITITDVLPTGALLPPVKVAVSCNNYGTPSGDCVCSFKINDRNTGSLAHKGNGRYESAELAGGRFALNQPNKVTVTCNERGYANNKATVEWWFTPVKPTASLSASPSSGTGPFSSILNARFQNLPDGATTAKFYCWQGDTPHEEVINGGTASHSCDYPRVERTTFYEARVEAAGGAAVARAAIMNYAFIPPRERVTNVRVTDYSPRGGAEYQNPISFTATCAIDGENLDPTNTCGCYAEYGVNGYDNRIELHCSVSRASPTLVENSCSATLAQQLNEGTYKVRTTCSSPKFPRAYRTIPDTFRVVVSGRQNQFAFCSVQPSTALVYKGESAQFAIKCQDETRSEIACPNEYYYDWSVRGGSNGFIGRVSPNGQATTTFYATAEGNGALAAIAKRNREWVVCTSSSVTVRERQQPRYLNSCVIAPSERSVDRGFTARFAVNCFDQFGAAFNCPASVTWGVLGDGGVRIGTIA
ncbi:MAG: hypothetical protein QW343_03415, partial [Candidatus Norongarragalinales archaeon]